MVFRKRKTKREREVKLRYVKSENNIADIFTKPLPPKVFYSLLELLYGFEYE